MKLPYGTTALLFLALACGSDSSTGPVTSILQNDNFTGGSAPGFQGGFVTTEAAAVRLGPQSAGYTISKVILMFGGDTATKTVTLTIYQDGDTLNPGAVLHSADYSLKGSDAALREINLASQNIHVNANQKIRVAVRFQHTGLPSVAVDGAITAGRNLIDPEPGGWIASETLSVTGDFIIRAEISTP